MRVIFILEVFKDNKWHQCNTDLGFLRFPYEKRIRIYCIDMKFSLKMWFLFERQQLKYELDSLVWKIRHLVEDENNISFLRGFDCEPEDVYSIPRI